MNRFNHHIRPYVDAELRDAEIAEAAGDAKTAFSHLERAHVLGQASTVQHVRVHWRMFLWGVHQQHLRECLGQLLRLCGAATKTAIGLVPSGNTGGANVSPFKSMQIPLELEQRIQQARTAARSDS